MKPQASPITPELIKASAQKHQAAIVDLRRRLHRHPELSNQEAGTARLLQAELAAIGLPFTAGYGGSHGIKALIQGGRPAAPGRRAPVIALRADMDALPISETTGLPFASENPGVMHACGHDGHMAMLMGAARILQELRGELCGTVVLLFQPSEEKAPGGAPTLIEAGALSDPPVDLILGQHINPGMPTGSFGFRPGKLMASVDDFFITIHGSGGHGAMPQLCVDPIAVSAQVINAVQLLVSRMADPRIPSVLSFGKIQGEGATNIIPGSVRLEGTFRTVDEAWREEALERIQRLVTLTAEAHHAHATVELVRGYPALVNDEALTRAMRAHAGQLYGADSVKDLELFMAAEDFAYYCQKLPACFYNIGTGRPDQEWNPPLHHSAMVLDESAIVPGSAMMAWLACAHLA